MVVYLLFSPLDSRASQVELVVKNPPANAGDARDAGSIPGSGGSPEGGHGNPLQYSCLGNPMNTGARQATVYEVAKSPTRLSTHTYHTHPLILRPTFFFFSTFHSSEIRTGFTIIPCSKQDFTGKEMFYLGSWKKSSCPPRNYLYF